MFGREKDHAVHDDHVAVDADLENDLITVEQRIETYLKSPTDELRNQLLTALERLDDQIDRSDAYEGSMSGSAAFGYGGKGSVIGETSSTPLAEEVAQSVLRAQIALIRAAKQDVAAPTPDTLADLRAASEALSGARTKEQPTP